MGPKREMQKSSETTRAALRSDLRSSLLGGLIVEDDDVNRFQIDFTGDHLGEALAILRPRNVDEVVAITKWCHSRAVSLVPQGGHTGLVAGATPSNCGDEVILSLERMNEIFEIDTENCVVVVEAGCILADVKDAVGVAGAYFPLSIGSQGSCQIGGAISTNAGGINVVRNGMARGLVLGLEVVLPDGRIFRDLSRLHKNNTGYDVKQMFIGAEGTLGTITAASLKLLPRPDQVETMLLALPSIAAVIGLFHRFRKEAGDLISAFELMLDTSIDLVTSKGERGHNPLGKTYPAYAIVEMSVCGGPPLKPWLEGYLETLLSREFLIDGVVAQNVGQAKEIWALRDGIVECQARFGRYLRTDISIPISSIEEYITRGAAAVTALVPGAQIHPYGHVGDGNLHFNVLRPLEMTEETFLPLINRIENLLFELTDDYDGSISAEHGIGVAKRTAFEKRAQPIKLELMQTIKAAIDPLNVMSPGRILSTGSTKPDAQ